MFLKIDIDFRLLRYVLLPVSTKCRLQTADCRLQTGYKMQTRYKMQTADCRLGTKCRLTFETVFFVFFFVSLISMLGDFVGRNASRYLNRLTRAICQKHHEIVIKLWGLSSIFRLAG